MNSFFPRYSWDQNPPHPIPSPWCQAGRLCGRDLKSTSQWLPWAPPIPTICRAYFLIIQFISSLCICSEPWILYAFLGKEKIKCLPYCIASSYLWDALGQSRLYIWSWSIWHCYHFQQCFYFLCIFGTHSHAHLSSQVFPPIKWMHLCDLTRNLIAVASESTLLMT